MFDVARIVGVFQDDDHPETCAVGITNEAGDELLFQVDDPETIMAMSTRLAQFAVEIHDNQSRSIDKVIDMFKGYPPGTTIGDILSGKAQKILSAVETTDERQGE